MGEERNQQTAAEVKEFVSGDSATTSVRKKASQATRSYNRKHPALNVEELCKEQPLVAVAVYAVLAVIVILLAAFACKTPIVPVCVIVIIETLLAVCLHNLPLWLHITVMIAEIICGVVFHQVALTILAAALYLAAIFTLRFLMREA